MTLRRPLMTAALALLLGACSNLPGSLGGSGSEALIEAAGIDNQLAALSRPVPEKSVEAPDFLLPDKVISSTNSAIASVLKPDDIRASLKTNIEQGMSSEQITEALAFYRSASGKQVVAAEAGQPGSNTQGNDPRTLTEIDTATGTSAIFAKLADQSIGDALDYANDHSCFGLDKSKFAGYLGGVVKRALVNAVQEAIRDNLNHRYNAMNPDALDAYLHFVQSPAGAQFFAARNKAINDSLQTLTTALSVALTEQVSQNCKSPATAQ